MNKKNGKSVYQPLLRGELRRIQGGNAKRLKKVADLNLAIGKYPLWRLFQPQRLSN